MYKPEIISIYSQSQPITPENKALVACLMCNEVYETAARYVVRQHEIRQCILCNQCSIKKTMQAKWQPIIAPLLAPNVKMPETQLETTTISCPKCKKPVNIRPVSILRDDSTSPTFAWCRSCSDRRPEVIDAKIKRGKLQKHKPHTEESKALLREKIIAKWQDPAYRSLKESQIKEQWADEEFKKRHFEASMAVQDQRVVNMKAHHSTPKFKEKQAQDSMDRWLNHDYRQKAVAHIDDDYKQKISIRMKIQRNSPEWKVKLSETAKKLWQNQNYFINSTTSDSDIKAIVKGKFAFLCRTGSYILVKCLKCGKECDRRLDRLNRQCPACFDRNRSASEEAIRQHVISLGFSPVKLRTGKPWWEIDVFIESKKLGIEHCGLYWHHENSRDPRGKEYHRNKLLKANALGYSLLTIFEDEWIYRQSQVKSYLSLILNAVTFNFSPSEVSAVIVPNDQASEFLDTYNIKPPSEFLFSVGLIYQDHLVFVATFSPSEESDTELSLTDFCTLPDVSIGYALSVVSTFIADNLFQVLNVSSIMAVSDNRWFNETFLKESGFIQVSEVEPDYEYCRRDKRFSKELVESMDTETIEDQDFNKVWDCGGKLLVWKQQIKSQ